MNYFNYFTEIEIRFQQRRGSILMLSTLDWALIETWRKAGVPLEAVLRGIDAAFDKHDEQRPASAAAVSARSTASPGAPRPYSKPSNNPARLRSALHFPPAPIPKPPATPASSPPASLVTSPATPPRSTPPPIFPRPPAPSPRKPPPASAR